MNTYDWYQNLIKPSWSPPSYIFGPVWTVLYILIAISFGYVFYQVAKRKFPAIVALPFALNLIFNLAFTPIQFGLKNNLLASIDILLVLATIIWSMIIIYPYIRNIRRFVIIWIFVAFPYLLWVAFATALQLTITYLNW